MLKTLSRRKPELLVLGLLLAALLLSSGCTQGTPSPKEATSLRGAVPLLRLRGSPYEMGYEQGRIFRHEMGELNKALHRELSRDPSLSEERLRRALSLFESQIPARFLEEMRGLAHGSGIPLKEVLVANVIYEVWSLGGGGFSCSSLVGRDEGGGLIVGRNLDYRSFEGALLKGAVLLALTPHGKNPFLKVGFAGMAGVWTGVNSKGLFVAMHTALSEDLSPKGLPVNLLLRKVLEEAGSLEDALSIIKDTGRVSGANILLVDGARGRAIVAETTASHLVVREPEQHGLVVTNHFLKNPLSSQLGYGESRARYEVLSRFLKERKGRLTLEEAYHALRRPGVLRWGEAGDFLTLQSVLFKARTMELWASLGPLALKEGSTVRLNVMAELNGSPGLVKKTPLLLH